ncbi:MAG: hypothetical protein HKN43_12720 [Rhodothermales bacterium]|nr:hypothetical protein [Rhodothermales bacterium]
MQELFEGFQAEDFAFIAGLLESRVNFSDDRELKRLLDASSEDTTNADKRDDLIAKMRDEIRYAGSSDLAYFYRWMRGGTPGVPVKQVFKDVSSQLDIPVDSVLTEREMVAHIAREYAEREFASLPDDDKIQMLEQLGVASEKATEFVKRSAGVYTIPVLIKTFSVVVVDGLIKRVLFGTIARIIGKAVADRLFALLLTRIPWWVGWIGPAAWTASLSWTAVDVAGPAYRKTIPITLYLGLNSISLDSDSVESPK